MRKFLLSAAAAVAIAAPITASAQLSANIGLVTDYRFRGISQTFKKPALQGGIDYSHSSGLYVGNWNSTINEGAGFPESKLEMDFYGGWKKSWGDLTLDLGGIYYYYPGSNASLTSLPSGGTSGTGTSFLNPNNAKLHTGQVDNGELYVGLSWKWFSAKYSHAVTDYFSLPGTRNSNYLDLGATFDLGNGWGINGHVGSFRLKGWSNGTDAFSGNYTDWKVGVTKDISGWILGASYIDTNGKGSCSAANPGFYCFSNNLPNAGIGTGTAYKDAGSGTLVLSVSKTFNF